MSERKEIDYTENDIYAYFGCPVNIWEADRHDLLAVIGGMSGILELLWHKEVDPEVAFKDFKDWLIDNQELKSIEVEVVEESETE